MEANWICQKRNGNERLCNEPFIRDIWLLKREHWLMMDVLYWEAEPSHRSFMGSLPNLDHMFMHHADSDELNPNAVHLL